MRFKLATGATVQRRPAQPIALQGSAIAVNRPLTCISKSRSSSVIAAPSAVCRDSRQRLLETFGRVLASAVVATAVRTQTWWPPADPRLPGQLLDEPAEAAKARPRTCATRFPAWLATRPAAAALQGAQHAAAVLAARLRNSDDHTQFRLAAAPPGGLEGARVRGMLRPERPAGVHGRPQPAAAAAVAREGAAGLAPRRGLLGHQQQRLGALRTAAAGGGDVLG